jgi:nitroreductase
MNLNEAIRSRKCVRAFTEKPVSIEAVKQILDAARFAPSGGNLQPWQVAVLMGQKKSTLCKAMKGAYESGIRPKMDYSYYPDEWPDLYMERQRACGMQLYQALGIKREEKERRRNHWATNYEGFGAPVILLFSIKKFLLTGSYIDYGMFLQSIMLSALSEGLATCPQAALGEYPDIVREQLHLGDDVVVLGGISLGYEDTAAPVNQFRTERAAVADFTEFFCDE